MCLRVRVCVRVRAIARACACAGVHCLIRGFCAFVGEIEHARK